MIRDSGYYGWLVSNGFVPVADLRGAYLRGADLSGAYLSGAYLRGAWRFASDPPVDGWHVVDGRMVAA